MNETDALVAAVPERGRMVGSVEGFALVVTMRPLHPALESGTPLQMALSNPACSIVPTPGRSDLEMSHSDRER
jgi:hypothetical protein